MADVNDFMKNVVPQDGELPEWATVSFDTSTPSIARVYDAFLNGKDNFAVDRQVAQAILEVVPESAQLASDNRAWIGRLVTWLVGEAGIRQIIDLGSGLPATNNVHDYAQRIAPETRVAYVDNDPIVLAHGRAMLDVNSHTTVITADVRDLDDVFGNAELRALIDLDEPFAIILAGVLHHFPDGQDRAVARTLRERLSPGSYLAIGNVADPGMDDRVEKLASTARANGMDTGFWRPYPQHRMYFGELDIIRPGLGPVNEWKPDDDTPTESPVHHLYLGGVGYFSG